MAINIDKGHVREKLNLQYFFVIGNLSSHTRHWHSLMICVCTHVNANNVINCRWSLSFLGGRFFLDNFLVYFIFITFDFFFTQFMFFFSVLFSFYWISLTCEYQLRLNNWANNFIRMVWVLASDWTWWWWSVCTLLLI